MFVSTALRHPGLLSGAAGGHVQPSSRTARMAVAAPHPHNNYDLRNEGPSASTVQLSIIRHASAASKTLYNFLRSA